MDTTTIYTTADAARQIGRSHSRVRQLCAELQLGRLIGATRILTADELQQIQQTERRDTRPIPPR